VFKKISFVTTLLICHVSSNSRTSSSFLVSFSRLRSLELFQTNKKYQWYRKTRKIFHPEKIFVDRWRLW